MPKLAKPAITLTPEQTAMVNAFYYLNLRELIQKVFANPALTLRSDPEVKAVKQALANMGKEAVPVPRDRDQELLNLLDETMREHIRNNYKDASGPLELARDVFENQQLQGFDKRVQSVVLYCRQLDPKFTKPVDDMADDAEYKVPANIMHVMGRVNRYALNARSDGKPLFDSTSLTQAQTAQLEALLSYMKFPLFKVEADKFVKKIDREVFESTFIANCWDKPDLTAAHVIQFIQLSSLIVKGNQLDRIAQKLDDRQSDNLMDPESAIKMSEVETLNAYREKINAGSKQIKDLIKTLEGERASINKEKRAGSASMHNLVSSWRNEDDRKKIIQLAERRQKAALGKEVERLSSMDSLKCEIFGIDKDNILR